MSEGAAALRRCGFVGDDERICEEVVVTVSQSQRACWPSNNLGQLARESALLKVLASKESKDCNCEVSRDSVSLTGRYGLVSATASILIIGQRWVRCIYEARQSCHHWSKIVYCPGGGGEECVGW
jgi:hypothetical protein